MGEIGCRRPHLSKLADIRLGITVESSIIKWPRAEAGCLGCVVSQRKIVRYYILSDAHEKECIQHSHLQA